MFKVGKKSDYTRSLVEVLKSDNGGHHVVKDGIIYYVNDGFNQEIFDIKVAEIEKSPA